MERDHYPLHPIQKHLREYRVWDLKVGNTCPRLGFGTQVNPRWSKDEEIISTCGFDNISNTSVYTVSTKDSNIEFDEGIIQIIRGASDDYHSPDFCRELVFFRKDGSLGRYAKTPPQI